MDDKLDKKMILQSIEQGLFGGGVHLFDSIDSTNDWSLAEIGRGRALPFVKLPGNLQSGLWTRTMRPEVEGVRPWRSLRFASS